MPSRKLPKAIWVLNDVECSAEGSLNQHVKLKHPELVKDRSYLTKSNEMSQQPEGDSNSDLKQEQQN